jgi:hypothetical protein
LLKFLTILKAIRLESNLQTEIINFRCSQIAKELLENYALDHDLFVSQVIRIAIDRFFFNDMIEKVTTHEKRNFEDSNHPLKTVANTEL